MFWANKNKKKQKREKAIQEAQSVINQKRAEVGEETLDKIRQSLLARENNALQGAKNTIMKADQDKVRDNLNLWLRE